jgi:hypothetical protein
MLQRNLLQSIPKSINHAVPKTSSVLEIGCALTAPSCTLLIAAFSTFIHTVIIEASSTAHSVGASALTELAGISLIAESFFFLLVAAFSHVYPFYNT